MTHSLGMLLLAIYLILVGVLAITNFTFAMADVVMALLAIAAGVLLLFRR